MNWLLGVYVCDYNAVNTMRKSIRHLFAQRRVTATLICFAWAGSVGAEPVFTKMEDAALDTCIKALMVQKNWATAEDVKSIKCHNKGISSAAGIEQFRN